MRIVRVTVQKIRIPGRFKVGAMPTTLGADAILICIKHLSAGVRGDGLREPPQSLRRKKVTTLEQQQPGMRVAHLASLIWLKQLVGTRELTYQAGTRHLQSA
jgi:hypothetical protein